MARPRAFLPTKDSLCTIDPWRYSLYCDPVLVLCQHWGGGAVAGLTMRRAAAAGWQRHVSPLVVPPRIDSTARPARARARLYDHGDASRAETFRVRRISPGCGVPNRNRAARSVVRTPHDDGGRDADPVKRLRRRFSALAASTDHRPSEAAHCARSAFNARKERNAERLARRRISSPPSPRGG